MLSCRFSRSSAALLIRILFLDYIMGKILNILCLEDVNNDLNDYNYGKQRFKREFGESV